MPSAFSNKNNSIQLFKQFIVEKNYEKLQDMISTSNQNFLNNALSKLSDDEMTVVVNIFPNLIQPHLISNYSLKVRNSLILNISNENLSKILNSITNDNIFSIISSVSIESKEKILSLLSTKQQGALHLKYKYIDFEIGNFISLNYIAVPVHWTVAETISFIDSQKIKFQDYKIIAVNEKFEAIGVIKISQLLIAEKNLELKKILDSNVKTSSINNSVNQISDELAKNNVDFIVIKDNQNKLIGIISAKDILSFSRFNKTNVTQLCFKKSLSEYTNSFFVYLAGFVSSVLIFAYIYLTSHNQINNLLIELSPFMLIQSLITASCSMKHFKSYMSDFSKPLFHLNYILEVLLNNLPIAIFTSTLISVLYSIKIGLSIFILSLAQIFFVYISTSLMILIAKKYCKEIINHCYYISVVSLISMLVLITALKLFINL